MAKFAFVALLLASLTFARGGVITPEEGRAIVTAHRDCVLPFSAVVSLSGTAGGRTMPAREQPVHGIGVVLTDDGLMVTALSGIDPSAMLNGMKMNSAAGKMDYNVTADLKEMKIIMPDGLELPASVVMKDADLDLAFFRPKAGNDDLKDVTFHPANLSEGGAAEVLDQVVILNRLNRTFSYQASSNVSEISSKIEKPRLLYRVTGVVGGSPVYTSDGKILGITAMHKPLGGDMNEAMGARGYDMLVVLPAAEIAKVAEQARRAKPPEEEPAESDAQKPAPSTPKDKAPSPAAPPAGEESTPKPEPG